MKGDKVSAPSVGTKLKEMNYENLGRTMGFAVLGIEKLTSARTDCIMVALAHVAVAAINARVKISCDIRLWAQYIMDLMRIQAEYSIRMNKNTLNARRDTNNERTPMLNGGWDLGSCKGTKVTDA